MFITEHLPSFCSDKEHMYQMKPKKLKKSPQEPKDALTQENQERCKFRKLQASKHIIRLQRQVSSRNRILVWSQS